MTKNTLLKTLIKVLVSVGIITILVVNLKGGQLVKALQAISVWQLGLALGIYLFGQLLSAIRWLVMAYSMRIDGSILRFYQYYLMGMYFGLFLPTAVGGDLGRALLLAKEKSSRWTKAFLSIVAERLSGLMGLLAFAIISLMMMQPPSWQVYISLFVPMFLMAALFGFCFRWVDRHRLGHWFIHRFVLKQDATVEPSEEVWPHPKAILLGLAISIVFHGLSILLQMAILTMLGAHLSFFLIAIIYGVSGLASMIPISLNGIGVREGTITFLLINWGHVPQEVATAFSLTWLSILLLATVPGGLLTLREHLRVPTRKNI